VDDADQTAIIGRVARDRPAGPWADDRSAGPEAGPAADTAAGLASLSFMTAAIRRRTRFWCVGAAVGLILGVGLFVAKPPTYQATAEAFLALGPNEDPVTSVNTDMALAESRPVAALALKKLGLQESVTSFLGSYTAIGVTNRVLLITVKAPSSGEAVRSANAVTTAFLQFRAHQLRAYQRLLSASLSQEFVQAKAQAASIARQVTALTSTATSPAQKTKLISLQTQLATLNTVQQSARSNQATTQAETNVAVRDSNILNTAAPVLHSRKKTAVIYALTGLIGGLAVSMGFIVVSALVSDRLRSRDDIAYALGAPVRFSVGRVRRRRLLSGRRGLAAIGDPNIERIAGYLRRGLPNRPGGAALAVVPADRADAAALATVALALSCARQGKRVIVADLCPGTPTARLLGTAYPGVHSTKVQDAWLVVVVPEPGDVAATGPRRPASGPAHAAPAPPVPVNAELAAAYSSADVLLTVAVLDPMLGGEHLATWADDAVVMVTAGESTWTRVQAVGEMVRLARLRLVSAVLIGADKTDETLGVIYTPTSDRAVKAAQNGSHPDADALLETADADPGAKRPDAG
jgi:capsular polysaccharide biosynthesis protein